MPSPDPITSTSIGAAAAPEVPALSYPLTPEALTPAVRIAPITGDPGGLEYASWRQHLGAPARRVGEHSA